MRIKRAILILLIVLAATTMMAMTSPVMAGDGLAVCGSC